MAKESGPDEPAEQVAAHGIERSRDRLARDIRGLRYELDVPARIKRSFQRQTTTWLVAAVVVGAVVVTLPRARKETRGKKESGEKPARKFLETGFLLGALRVTATLLKPVIVNMIRNRMTGGGKFSGRSSGK